MTFLAFPILVKVLILVAIGMCVVRRCIARSTHSGACLLIVAICACLFLLARSGNLRLTESNSRVTAPLPIAATHIQLPSLPTTSPATQTTKLWVSDWSSFLNSTRAGGQWLRADSAGYFATDIEARQSAREQAVNMLQSSLYDPALPSELLRRQIATALESVHGLVVDENFERIERPYGEVWRCSLLINMTPATGRLIKAAAMTSVQSIKKEKLTTLGSIAALMLVILLTYLFLNAATKGYFVWKLRAAFVMMVIVAVLVLSGNLRV